MEDKSIEHYLGKFKPNERFFILCDRLQEYYNDTPDSMNNKTASGYWQRFLEWCVREGYSRNEINRAKIARRYN